MLTQLNKNILVSLVKKIQDKGLDLGKIQFQKLIYFLQEKGVALDYDYGIYHYGPYCFDLSNDLDLLSSFEILNVAPDQQGYGYHISTGHLADSFSDKDERVLADYNASLEFIIDKFARCDPSEIELKATIHYVNNIMKNHDPQVSREDVLSKVRELKPKFALPYVEQCYEELSAIFPLK